jgi:putative ABC transport system permease protein
MSREPLDGLDDEMRDHLDRETQDNIDRGMTPEAARAAARRKFGSVALAMEDARAVWIPVWVDQVLQDARYALRLLRRAPGFSVIVILTLALGIGMNIAVFSVVNAVLIRPLSFPHPDRVVWLTGINPRVKDEHVTAVDFLGWQRDATTLERLVAYDTYDDRLSHGGTVLPVRLAAVTDDFWELAGARPALGRRPAAGEAAVMVSHAFYEQGFASDPGIVGKTVTISGQEATIAGVLPLGFQVQLPPPPSSAALAPQEIDAYRAFVVGPPQDGRMQLLRVLALLKPGVSVSTSHAELTTIHGRVAKENPGIPADASLRVIPLADKLVGDARASLVVLLAAVVLVLLIACANIANLMLARSSARQREIAIRAAVGAGRGRVLRQFLVESLLLAGVGGAAGLLAARWALKVMLRLIPQAVPRLTETTIDGRVLAFGLALSAATALLCGGAPAIALWRTNTYEVLKDGARTATATSGSLRVRTLLVAAELALTVVLLCGAGLLVKSVWVMREYPPGFAPDRSLTITVKFSGPEWRNADGRRIAYVDEVLRRVPSVPGIEAAGITTNAGGRMRLFVEGGPEIPDAERPVVLHSSVSAGYARAIGMRMVAGRWLTDAEPGPVFVINESLARRDFAGEDPIGKRIRLGGPPGSPVRYARVVGVVADLRSTKLDATPEPEIFADYAHSAPFAVTLVVRAAGDPLALASTIRSRLVEIDKTTMVSDVTTVEQVLADSIAPRRFNVFLFGTFAASALLLALIGIYGVIAYSVAQRTHEIGVRMALGAERGTVVGMVVQQGMAIAAAGLLFGLAAALALTRVMTGLLYNVTPTDPATFAVVIAALAATALAACCGPALKAARVDPLVALRYE